MGGTQGGAFFLDQDKPNQGRKVKSWHPSQKENAHESQTGSWRTASGGMNGTFLERGGLTSRQRVKRKHKETYLPLEFDPGQDAQVDWCQAELELAGEKVLVDLFIMHLNYSIVRFVMAFPFQKQEAFFESHIQAFHFFCGVPRRISYDDLKTAVFKILERRNRQE